MIRILFSLSFAAVCLVPPAKAGPGAPVAVRWWGQGMVSIETYWNLRVVVDPVGPAKRNGRPAVAADLVLLTHDYVDPNSVDFIAGEPHIDAALDDRGRYRSLHHMLDRFPNESTIQWRDYRRWIKRDTHVVEVTSISSSDGNQDGAPRANAMVLVEADGARIVHCGALAENPLSEKQIEGLGRVDLLVLPIGGRSVLDGRQAASVVRQIAPRRVVPIYYSPSEPGELDAFLDVLRSDHEIFHPAGNTVAIRSFDGREPVRPQVFVLDYRPWEMPPELSDLFAAKEAASEAAEKVFAPLGANQMNHRPGDGTHTPRWNAEHMMGRELGFFTAIYAELDPELAHIDLNPAQMPADYVAAHPDWTGAEEAHQLGRVADFTRRFSYLLDGVDLDKPAPGSRWTPRQLLERMDTHYHEHTANVVNKFALPDWPAE